MVERAIAVRACARAVVVWCMAAMAAAVAAGDAETGAAGEELRPSFGVAEVHSLVGSADGDLFVGIDVLEPEDPEAAWPIAAYLCDGERVSTWLRGAFDGSDATLIGDGVRVEVSLVGEGAYGSVTFDGELPRALTAAAAAGEAGLYRADATLDGANVSGGWIVLPDGRQRGAVRTGGGTENPVLDLATFEAETSSAGRVGACCCGLVFPCDLACCRPLGDPFDDWGPPAATPSPN